ncbi:hypothetical protein F2Q70_00039335 [Brassica cretica]|uniref:Uncharacterized protein n=1 Tax=Brassica cretica TaxID=69181 RepID=A0A8S9K1M2_BRACR|nr:hypothetical protein F2Q70_00039335 [Brassica cretica]
MASDIQCFGTDFPEICRWGCLDWSCMRTDAGCSSHWMVVLELLTLPIGFFHDIDLILIVLEQQIDLSGEKLLHHSLKLIWRTARGCRSSLWIILPCFGTDFPEICRWDYMDCICSTWFQIGFFHDIDLILIVLEQQIDLSGEIGFFHDIDLILIVLEQQIDLSGEVVPAAQPVATLPLFAATLASVASAVASVA